MSFTMFSQPDYFFETFSPCPGASQGCLNDGFAWIHGDYLERHRPDVAWDRRPRR